MKKLLPALTLLLSCIAIPAQAGLDDLLTRLDNQAKSDLSNFSARISAQFGVSDARVKVVISSVKKPADAFMIFQIGKMSGQPPDRVLDVYHRGKGKGWGALAKDLGIKPGSPEFHALKRGDFDLAGGPGGHGGQGKSKGKDKEKGNGKGKDKHG